MKAARIHLLLFAILGLAVYGQSLLHDFVWDDHDAIVENALITQWPQVRQLLSRDYFILSNELSYRPLVTLTYFIDYSVWKLNPLGYHLTNLLIHVIAALLLAAFARRLTNDRALGWLAGCLFLMHPVNTEAVNVPAFREDLLAGLFMMGALILHLRYERASGARSLLFLAGALALYLAGLFSKEMAATLPLLVVIHDLVFIPGLTPRRFLIRCAKTYSAYLAVAAFYLAVRFVFLQNPREQALTYLDNRFAVSALTTTQILATYVRLMLIPVGLCAKYAVSPIRAWSDPRLLLSLCVLGLCLMYAGTQARRRQTESFAVFGFLATLLPAANLIPIVNMAAERYLYVPCMAFCLFFAAFLRREKTAPWIVTLLLAAYALGTARRTADWKDGFTIWTRTAQQVPADADIHHELGDAWRKQGRLSDAVREYRRALALAPRHLGARVNLGVTYDDLGRQEEALAEYLSALQVDPASNKLRINIGNIHVKAGRYDDAIQQYLQAIRLNPYYPLAYVNLSTAYLRSGRLDDALAAARQAVSLSPDDSSLQLALANLLLQKGDEREALQRFTHLMQAGRHTREILYTLSDYYLRHDRYREAIDVYRQLLTLEPENVGCHYDLGLLYEQLGDAEEARRHYGLFIAAWRGDPAFLASAREAMNRLSPPSPPPPAEPQR